MSMGCFLRGVDENVNPEIEFFLVFNGVLGTDLRDEFSLSTGFGAWWFRVLFNLCVGFGV